MLRFKKFKKKSFFYTFLIHLAPKKQHTHFKSLTNMEAYDCKCDDIQYGVNSLSLGGIHIISIWENGNANKHTKSAIDNKKCGLCHFSLQVYNIYHISFGGQRA